MSDLAYWVNELRAAKAAEFAEPLPCTGLQAYKRSVRVYLAERAVLSLFSR